MQAIAAYYQSYLRLKPLLRQRAINEAELSRLQRKLGQDRVQLHNSKESYDKADCYAVELAQKLLDQRSKIRRPAKERDDALSFYDDLTFCSKEWTTTKAELALSIQNFEIEMLLATIYVFLIARYEPSQSQALIDAIIKDEQLAKFKDRRTLLARFTGKKFETHERGVNHLIGILKDEQIEHHLLSWSQHGPNKDYDKLLISSRHDRQDLIVEFKRRFSHASREAKTENILLRHQAIIESEIEEFDLRLYKDLCSDRRRLIAKRRTLGLNGVACSVIRNQ